MDKKTNLNTSEKKAEREELVIAPSSTEQSSIPALSLLISQDKKQEEKDFIVQQIMREDVNKIKIVPKLLYSKLISLSENYDRYSFRSCFQQIKDKYSQIYPFTKKIPKQLLSFVKKKEYDKIRYKVSSLIVKLKEQKIIDYDEKYIIFNKEKNNKFKELLKESEEEQKW